MHFNDTDLFILNYLTSAALICLIALTFKVLEARKAKIAESLEEYDTAKKKMDREIERRIIELEIQEHNNSHKH